jgi:hypothetical protein
MTALALNSTRRLRSAGFHFGFGMPAEPLTQPFILALFGRGLRRLPHKSGGPPPLGDRHRHAPAHFGVDIEAGGWVWGPAMKYALESVTLVTFAAFLAWSVKIFVAWV